MFLLIDKEKRMTSHDVVSFLRKITSERKIGHGGTLDPNATGLLVVGIGRSATKRLSKIAKNTKKTYIGEIFLGEERDTDDAEGEVIARSGKVIPPTKKEVERVLQSFIGTSSQMPPAFSAIKIKGKKAYELARKGKKPILKPRSITVYSIKLLEFNYPTLRIECEVSSGTYIRALARDIGQKLAVGGYLKNLRRTKIGKFAVTKALKLQSLTKDNWKDNIIDL